MSLTRYRRILSMRERLAVLPLVRLGNATSLIADVLRLVRDAPTSLLRAVAALGRRVRTALDGAVAVNVLGLRAVRDTRVAYDVAELGRVDRARGELEGAAQRSCSCRDAGLEDRRAVVWSDGIAALGLELVVRRGLVDYRTNGVTFKIDGSDRRIQTIAEALRVGSDIRRGLRSDLGEQVAADGTKVGEEPAGLGVDEDEHHGRMRRCLTATMKTSELQTSRISPTLLTALYIAVDVLAVDERVRVRVLLGAVDVDVAGVPDKAVEEVVRVLLADRRLRHLKGVADVFDQPTAVGGERPFVDE
jgi:hypothetical protein